MKTAPHKAGMRLKKTTFAQKFAEKTVTKAKAWNEIVPSQYHRHHKVFSEEAARRFPTSRPWDHTIELKEGAPESIDCKVYPLGPNEQVALKEYLAEHLKKGYI